MRGTNGSKSGVLMLLAGVLGLGPPAAADLLMPLDHHFSGTQPTGGGPWVSTAFTEISGGVQLTVTAQLAEGESITRLLFNVVEPTRGVDILNTNTQGPSWFQILGKVTNPGATLAFQAPDEGYFDFRIDWHAGVFTDNQVFTMNFIGAQYHTGMFDTTSEGGIHRIAAMVQGQSGSGWVGNIPAPSAMLALAGGLVAFGRRRRG
jgi:hypothetical protein